MSANWTSLEKHAINGKFPLVRLLGTAEHSAVFLSCGATDASTDVALKLIPAIAGRAELLLPRWRSAIALDQPHLLRLFEAGECELGGQHYLYSVTEYAEQNLAQLLERRALSPDEVREMLGPTLNALEFLHGSKRVHGGLKPSNILVVGEQIKLASDAIGPASDVVNNEGGNAASLSPYQPPETSSNARSTAGDIWALGILTCEALSRRKPAGLHAIGGGIVLPPNIPATFHEMISKCLSRKPQERPDVGSLQTWLRTGELKGTPASPPAPASLPPSSQVPGLGIAGGTQDLREGASPPVRLVIRAKLMPRDENDEPVELKAQWRPIPIIIAAVVLLAMAAGGIYFFALNNAPRAKGPVPTPPVTKETPQPMASVSQTQTTENPQTVDSLMQASATAVTAKHAPPQPPAQSDAGIANSTVNEVIPTVARSARQTVRGTIRVTVRVTVDQDGNVVAANSENAGPSRYFERLSLEAAKKWTFVPATTGNPRLMLVKFNYTRSGTTAKAAPTQ